MFRPEIEGLPLEEQRALQEERLAAHIEQVRGGSAFYRERLAAVRSLDELAAQPFGTKQELLAAQADERAGEDPGW